MATTGESQLEKFIVDFVLDKTTHLVRLHLSDDITVRPVHLPRTGGEYLLATFWANVVQHQLNYPADKFTYSRRLSTSSDQRPHELLLLDIKNEGIRLLIDMTSGELTMSGKLVYEWFTTKFRQMLENVNAQFASNWMFVPTPTGDLPQQPGDHQTNHCDKTETEAYLVMEGRASQRIDQQLQNQLNDSATDVTMSQDIQVRWSSDDVIKQLTSVLDNGGGLFDGSLFIYPLWLSVLRQWFSQADGATIYIASPHLDHTRLADIVNVCIKFVDVQLGGLYINFDTCDPDCPAASDASHLQHRVLQQYDHALTRAAVEYRVLRHIVYPLNDRLAGSGSFIARSSASGSTVDVILTGSSFHARDLCRHRLSTVVLVRTKFDVFRQGYLVPLESKALTSTKLYCNQ